MTACRVYEKMEWKNKGNELKNFEHKYINKKRIIIYGINDYYYDLIERIKPLNIDTVVCRQSTDEYSNLNLQYEVHTIDQLLESVTEDSFMVIAAQKWMERWMIKKKLLLSGAVENIDFSDIQTFSNLILPVIALYNYGMCYIPRILHPMWMNCTLRCKNCSGLFPYYKDKMQVESLDEFREELRKFFNKVDYVYNIDLTSGETFIHGELLAEKLSFMFDTYGDRIGKCSFVTNATVVPSERVFSVLKKYKNRLDIQVSYYDTIPGWISKFEKFKQTFHKNDIPFSVVNAEYFINYGFMENRTREKISEKELKMYFDECGHFDCMVFLDGRIGYCGDGLLANRLLQYYDNSSEWLDITSDSTNSNVILEYILGFQEKGYLDICNYCNGWIEKNKFHEMKAEQLDK